MDTPTGNVCIRCGKLRVISKTWEEKLLNSVLTCASYVCPDSECQKMVEKQLARRAEDRVASEKAREERAFNNKRNRSLDLSKKTKNYLNK